MASPGVRARWAQVWAGRPIGLVTATGNSTGCASPIWRVPGDMRITDQTRANLAKPKRHRLQQMIIEFSRADLPSIQVAPVSSESASRRSTLHFVGCQCIEGEADAVSDLHHPCTIGYVQDLRHSFILRQWPEAEAPRATHQPRA
jgi:hypothetical protein